MPKLLAEINAMTSEEKVATMDFLWTSLISTPETIEPPAWHEDLLNERRMRAESGAETFVSWEEAKKSLRAEFA